MSIKANVAAFVIGTIPEVFIHQVLFFVSLIAFSLVIFTIEFMLRIWACTINPKFHDHIRGRIRLLLTPWPILTLLVIVPLRTTVITGGELDTSLNSVTAVQAISSARIG